MSMNESKITAVGQTTIPAAVRAHLGLNAGDRLRYFIEEERVIMVPAKSSIRDLKGLLPKPVKTVGLEEMDEAIAEAAQRGLTDKS